MRICFPYGKPGWRHYRWSDSDSKKKKKKKKPSKEFKEFGTARPICYLL